MPTLRFSRVATALPSSSTRCHSSSYQLLKVAALAQSTTPAVSSIRAQPVSSFRCHSIYLLPSLSTSIPTKTSATARLGPSGSTLLKNCARSPRLYGLIRYRSACGATGAGSCVTGTCGGAASAVEAAAAAVAAAPVGTAAASAASPLMDMFAVVLGYACLAGSLFRSVPQIAIILRTGSAEGLSLTSNLMELLCFTISVAYNIQQGYAFNTYGEVFACWIQDVVIVGLIFRHMRLSFSTITVASAAFAACCVWLFSPMCPMNVLSSLQLSTIVVMAVGARLPQILLNVRRGNAGVLSPLTCLLNVAGCVVRVFTTAVLTVGVDRLHYVLHAVRADLTSLPQRDGIIMGGCITQLILNAILLHQSITTPGRVVAAAGASPPLSSSTSSTAAVAATDPPIGGAGEARGQPTGMQAAAGATMPGTCSAFDGDSSSSTKSLPATAPFIADAGPVLYGNKILRGDEGSHGGAFTGDGGDGDGSALAVPAAA